MLKFEQNKVHRDRTGQPDDSVLAKVAAIVLGIDPSVRETEYTKREDSSSPIIKKDQPVSTTKYLESFEKKQQEDELEIIIENPAPKVKIIQEQVPFQQQPMPMQPQQSMYYPPVPAPVYMSPPPAYVAPPMMPQPTPQFMSEVKKPEYEFDVQNQFSAQTVPMPVPVLPPEEEKKKFTVKKLPPQDVNAYLKKSSGMEYEGGLTLQVNETADKTSLIIPTLAEAEEARHKAQMIMEAEQLKRRQEGLERAKIKRMQNKQEKKAQPKQQPPPEPETAPEQEPENPSETPPEAPRLEKKK